MAKMNDIDNHSEAFSCGNYKGRDVLLKHLDHSINYQLSKGIQDGEIEKITLNLFMIRDKIDNVIDLEGYDCVKESYQSSKFIYSKIHLDYTRLIF